MIKGSTLQSDTRVINTCAFNKQNWSKLTELMGEIDNSIVIAGNFNIPLSKMYKTKRLKSIKNVKDSTTL